MGYMKTLHIQKSPKRDQICSFWLFLTPHISFLAKKFFFHVVVQVKTLQVQKSFKTGQTCSFELFLTPKRSFKAKSFFHVVIQLICVPRCQKATLIPGRVLGLILRKLLWIFVMKCGWEWMILYPYPEKEVLGKKGFSIEKVSLQFLMFFLLSTQRRNLVQNHKIILGFLKLRGKLVTGVLPRDPYSVSYSVSWEIN